LLDRPQNPAREPVALDLRDLKAFGERIAARDPHRQGAEIQTCVAHIIRFNARIYL